MSKTERVAARVDLEFYEQLDKKRFDEKTTFQHVVSSLLRQWLEGDREAGRHEQEDGGHGDRLVLTDPDDIKITTMFLKNWKDEHFRKQFHYWLLEYIHEREGKQQGRREGNGG